MIRALEARIQVLEDQISKNSGNSSKPPTSDGLKRKAKRSLRHPSWKKNGGQKGHKGHHLESVVDEMIAHAVKQCEQCQASLEAVDVSEYKMWQVFDLPEIKVFVTEHQAEVKTCPECGQDNIAAFPPGVSHPEFSKSKCHATETIVE